MLLQDVTRVDMRAACEHFSRCFRNPAEFKVVFTGEGGVGPREGEEVERCRRERWAAHA